MEVKVLTKPLKETDWDGKPDPEEKREGGEEIEWEEPVTVFELINRSGQSLFFSFPRSSITWHLQTYHLLISLTRSLFPGIPALPTRTQLNTVHARPVSSEIKIPGFPPARLVMVSTPHGENGIRVVTEHVTDNWRNEAVWSLEGNDKLTRTMWFKKGKFERRYKVVNERKV